ncbi:MAG: GWxTD domain-containing protein, partial [bacterium]
MKRSGLQKLIAFAFSPIIVCSLQSFRPGTGIAQTPGSTQPTHITITADSLTLTQKYLTKLNAANDSRFRYDFEHDFFLILDKKQKEYYQSLPTVFDRKAFIKQYWMAYNPNPLLPQNDRLLSHIQRVGYAREHFAADEPPYFDDRGKYHIIYGKPSVRYADPGGIRRIAFFSQDIYRLISNRFYNLKGAPQQNYSVPPNESWAYENVSPDFVIHFVARGAEYREVASLAKILPTQRKAHLAWQWSDLIKHRASISPALSHAANEIELFESELVMNMSVDYATGNRLTKNSAHTKMIKTIEKGESIVEEAKRHIPPTAYDPIHAKNKLVFYYDSAQFRGEDGKTRVEVDFFVPFKKNFVIELDALAADTLQLEMSAMLRDRFFRPIARKSASRIAYAHLAARNHFPFVVERLSFELTPQKSELSVQVENQKSRDIGFAKTVYPVVDFSGNALMLSDIQFYTEITSEEQKSALPVFELQGLQLLPYPEPTVRKSRALLCYFEIYNLQSSGITDAFEVSYKV